MGTYMRHTLTGYQLWHIQLQYCCSAATCNLQPVCTSIFTLNALSGLFEQHGNCSCAVILFDEQHKGYPEQHQQMTGLGLGEVRERWAAYINIENTSSAC